jgi:putative flippase GtrA
VAAGSGRLKRLAREVGKFGVVGAVAYVVDVGLYNLLRFSAELDPYSSKTISTLVAIAVAYVGNRHWTWRGRSRHSLRRESLMFAAVNAGGLLIGLGCLGFTVYVLGLHGRVAENVAGNVVGVALGTLFRFWLYRTWVFPRLPDGDAADDALERTTVTPY